MQTICTSGSCKDSSSIFLSRLHFTQSSSTSCVSLSFTFAWSSVKCIVNCSSSHADLFLKRWKLIIRIIFSSSAKSIFRGIRTSCSSLQHYLQKIWTFKFRTFCLISDKFRILCWNMASPIMYIGLERMWWRRPKKSVLNIMILYSKLLNFKVLGGSSFGHRSRVFCK